MERGILPLLSQSQFPQFPHSQGHSSAAAQRDACSREIDAHGFIPRLHRRIVVAEAVVEPNRRGDLHLRMQDAVARWAQSQNAGLPFAVCFRLMRRAHVDTAEFPAVWFWPDSSHMCGQVARVACEPAGGASASSRRLRHGVQLMATSWLVARTLSHQLAHSCPQGCTPVAACRAWRPTHERVTRTARSGGAFSALNWRELCSAARYVLPFDLHGPCSSSCDHLGVWLMRAAPCRRAPSRRWTDVYGTAEHTAPWQPGGTRHSHGYGAPWRSVGVGSALSRQPSNSHRNPLADAGHTDGETQQS